MKAKIMKPTSEENATLPRIQAYSKSQLATLYLPHIQPASARRTLRSWIAKNTALQNELARTGYSEKAILLTPAQVGLIFRFGKQVYFRHATSLSNLLFVGRIRQREPKSTPLTQP